MKAPEIRVEPSEEMYNALIEIQKNRQQENGRKPALSSLILEFCQIGLTINDNNPVQDSIRPYRQAKESLPDKHNKQMDTFYFKSEVALNERVSSLREQENELMEARAEFFQKQNDFIQEKEKFANQPHIGTEKIIELAIQKVDIAHKNDTIQNLQKENSKNETVILKALKNIENMLQKMDVEPTLLDKIIPWIPAAVNLIGFYMINNKLNSSNNVIALPQELQGVLNSLAPEGQEKVTKSLMDAIQEFQKKQGMSENKASKKEKSLLGNIGLK